MVAAATRQDIQTALDRAKDSILGNMPSRNDFQTLVVQLRNSILQDLHDMHAENQQAIRVSLAHRDQMMVRISNVERNLLATQQLMARLYDQQMRMLGVIQR